jgi:formamidopyrimidine-DNA glycosylase
MPELAEVEFNRKQWDLGLRRRVLSVELHLGTRVFRGTDTEALRAGLVASCYRGSEGLGKQMLFRFSGGGWLGLHLGMTGRLHAEPPGYTTGRHDHMVLFQSRCTLVFTDPRQFGRVQFHLGPQAPAWWSRLPPSVTGKEFTLVAMESFLRRHDRLAIKAALLLQEGFPGIGNWIADEILWRCRIAPRTRVGRLKDNDLRQVWRIVRWVSRRALETIGENYSDPPAGWMFHERWSTGGLCPRDRLKLNRGVVGGRTTAWCATCQK